MPIFLAVNLTSRTFNWSEYATAMRDGASGFDLKVYCKKNTKIVLFVRRLAVCYKTVANVLIICTLNIDS